MTPTSYGTYADPFMLKDRDLNEDEMVEYIVPQLQSAAKLGFTIARLQYFSYTAIETLLPWAEKLNVKLGYEGRGICGSGVGLSAGNSSLKG